MQIIFRISLKLSNLIELKISNNKLLTDKLLILIFKKINLTKSN